MVESENEKYSSGLVEIKHYCKKIDYLLFNSTMVSEILPKVLNADPQIKSMGYSDFFRKSAEHN